MVVFITFLRKLLTGFKSNLGLAFFFFLVIFVYSSVGFYFFEKSYQTNLTWYDSAWWSLVTMTTVGYGDLAPVSVEGRFLIGYPTLIVGVALIGYFLSLLASFVFESRMSMRKGRMLMKLENHVLIVRFSSEANVARLINEIRKDRTTSSSEIVIIDHLLDELPPCLVKERILFVKGNPGELRVLDRANFRFAKSAIILADLQDPLHSDLKNLAVMITLKSEAKQLRAIVECLNPEHVDLFTRAGCDSVVCLSAMASQMIAQEMQDPGTLDIVSELTSNAKGKQFYVIDVPGKYQNYGEVRESFKDHGAVLAGVRRGQDNYFLPDSNFHIEKGDKAVFIAAHRPKFMGS